ncbi:MAG: hypothetical protein QW303_01935, partial [Nitrososphaerota archaeon]
LYGYEESDSFFGGGIQNHSFPIPIMDYVFLRAQLMMHLNDVAELVGTDWCVGSDKVEKILSLTKIDSQLIDGISAMMEETEPTNNLSYAAIDLNMDLL